MKIKFQDTINVLKELNEFKKEIVYSQDELEEQNDNIDDIDDIEKRFKMTIECLNNIDKNDENEIMKKLIDLHLVYSDFIWQYEQMHEMIKKMISKYRKE
ncbi:hypothetical protein ACJDT4_00295 [Clostridium neuense]|uniref:Uncharacterized protein n=1 Tax=Clostridium neuense TaxID=1728934 RepID=A0ABW8T8L2_9CLOT